MLVKRLLLPALVALVFVLAACGDDSEPVVGLTAAPTDTVTPVAAADAATPTAPPAPTQPASTARATSTSAPAPAPTTAPQSGTL